MYGVVCTKVYCVNYLSFTVGTCDKNHVKYLNSVDTADDYYVHAHVMQLICIIFELFLPALGNFLGMVCR